MWLDFWGFHSFWAYFMHFEAFIKGTDSFGGFEPRNTPPNTPMLNYISFVLYHLSQPQQVTGCGPHLVAWGAQMVESPLRWLLCSERSEQILNSQLLTGSDQLLVINTLTAVT